MSSVPKDLMLSSSDSEEGEIESSGRETPPLTAQMQQRVKEPARQSCSVQQPPRDLRDVPTGSREESPAATRPRHFPAQESPAFRPRDYPAADPHLRAPLPESFPSHVRPRAPPRELPHQESSRVSSSRVPSFRPPESSSVRNDPAQPQKRARVDGASSSPNIQFLSVKVGVYAKVRRGFTLTDGRWWCTYDGLTAEQMDTFLRRDVRRLGLGRLVTVDSHSRDMVRRVFPTMMVTAAVIDRMRCCVCTSDTCHQWRAAELAKGVLNEWPIYIPPHQPPARF